MSTSRTAYRICPLCEATCGLELRIEGDRITRARGDRDDVFSKGFICPKGSAYGHVVHDPDRLRRPMIRDGERWREVDWPEAFAEVERRLAAVTAEHGREAVARLRRQSQPSQHRRWVAPRPRSAGARLAQHLLGEHDGPAPQAGGQRLPLRPPERDRRARPRSHRLRLAARRRPVRVERVAGDGSRLAGPAAGDPGSRRCRRRGRPTAQQDRRDGRRAPGDASRHRCACSSPPSPTSSWPKSSPRPVGPGSTPTAWSSCPPPSRRSPPTPSASAVASIPSGFGRSPVVWPAPNTPSSMAGSARRRSPSARSPAGSWTSATC